MVGTKLKKSFAIVVSQLNRPKQPLSIMHKLFVFNLVTGNYVALSCIQV